MTSREKAQSGLALIHEAITEIMRDNPGISAAQARAILGLDAWSIMNVVAGLIIEASDGQSCC